MKIGFAQFDCKLGDKEKNLAAIERLTKKANADVLVFPELCITGYQLKNKAHARELAESVSDGSTSRRLTKIAHENNTLIVAGMIELVDKTVADTSIAVSPNGYIAKHQKLHLFLREKGIFISGKTRPKIFTWRGVRIGLGVCYDYMFPEFWRSLAMQGADIFCNTANFVYDYGFKMMQARAIENGVFSVCANRVGTERGTVFRGGSEIVNNRGNVLAKAGLEEEVIVIDLDLKKSRNKQWNPYNDLLKDRRPDMY